MVRTKGRDTLLPQARRVPYNELVATPSTAVGRPKVNLKKPHLERPKEERQGRAIGRVVACIVGIVCVGGMIFGLTRLDDWLARSPFFVIQKIGVDGNKRLRQEEIITYSGVKVGQRLYAIDPVRVTERLATHPWIKEVTVSRRPPRGVLIRVVEREPTAMITLGGRLYAIDRDTVLMPMTSSIPELPLFTGVRPDSFRVGCPLRSERLTTLLTFVEKVKEVDETFIRQISDLRPAGWGSVAASLMASGLEVRMRTDDLEEQIDWLKKLLNRSEFHGEDRLAYVDLRFADQVIVGLEKEVRKGR